MSRSQKIEQILKSHLNVLEIYLEDESQNHSGNQIETHFKLYLVSADFEGTTRLDRQRQVYSLLKDEFLTGLHALSLKAVTPQEREQQGPESFISPVCLGFGD